MNRSYFVSTFLLFFMAGYTLPAQEESYAGLEDILVEKYHTVGGKLSRKERKAGLEPGMVTYRIYVDLKPEYNLQAVYGLKDQPLVIETNSHFYNHQDYGAQTGDRINEDRLDQPGVAIDSWLSFGPASQAHIGVPLNEDSDGSVLPRAYFQDADGLKEGKVDAIIVYGMELDAFDDASDASVFATENGAWAVLGGVKGPTPDNRILIAQVTTPGKLSFSLNIQIGAPDCEPERYVARNPREKDFQSNLLIYPRPPDL